MRDLKNIKTVGVINKDKEKGIIEIAKPVGVVAAITPSTNPAATPINNIINALKTRNSIIISPSPAGDVQNGPMGSHLKTSLSNVMNKSSRS